MGRRQSTAKSARKPTRSLSAAKGAPPKKHGSTGPSSADPSRFPNIEFLIEDRGDITIGDIGPIRCAAVAAAEWGQLAALVRRKGESILQLLGRLDAAIARALEDEDYVDEINNGPSNAV